MIPISLWEVERGCEELWRGLDLQPRVLLRALPHLRYDSNIAERVIEAAALEAAQREGAARAEERKLSDLY